MDQRDEGKVITLTWRFSAISILAHCGENHPTLKRSLCKNLEAKADVWQGTGLIFHTIAKLDQALYSHCTVQTNDIKTSNPDHALSIESYPDQTTCFLCQTTRGQEGGGRGTIGLLQKHQLLEDFSLKKEAGFLVHAIVIVIWLL